MASKSIDREHAKRIQAAIQPSVGYLFRLKLRMEDVGFLPDDPLYQLVKKAYEAMHGLSVELNYRACAGGVGKAPNLK